MVTTRLCLLFAVIAISGAIPATLLLDIGSEETEQNHQALDRIRVNAERMSQLQANLRVFNGLSSELRNRMRRLDRDIAEESSGTQVHLLRTAERYSAWLDTLSATDRERILSETNKEKRLDLIKELRRKQWIEDLPRAYQERLANAKDSEKAGLIRQFRDEDSRRRQEWQLAMRHWDEITTQGPPDRLEKFPPTVRDFVNETLLPRLAKDEKDRLLRAEGRWPVYPRTLVSLTDRDAFRLLTPATGPTRLEDLPEDFRKKLQNAKQPNPKRPFKDSTGKWPEFAIAVTEVAKRNNIPLPKQFGPCLPKEFAKPVQKFIVKVIGTVLDKNEKEQLRLAEGYWPNYPKTLIELAQKHHLHIPGTTLPGSQDYWDRYRVKSDGSNDDESLIDDATLRDFLLLELNAEERAALNASLADRSSRQRLQQEYAKRHPDEWQKLQVADQQKRLLKKAADSGK